MDIDPDTIFYGVLGFMWLEFLWQGYIGYRQKNIYKTKTEVPAELESILDKETFTKARLYALDKANFGGIQGWFSQILSTAILWWQGYAFFWSLAADSLANLGYSATDNEILQSLLFTLYMDVFGTITNLPFSVYNNFVVEEKHGFNKQTAGFYVKDQIKKFVVGQAIQAPMYAAVIKIVYWGGDHFYVYLWFFTVFMVLFLMTVYPDFIAPLFDKYTPMPDGEIKTRIEELAASVEFPLYKLYVVEGSKRSSHSNAYFYGFYKFKRIVLFDTLLEEEERLKLKTEEDLKKEEEEKKKKKEGDEKKNKKTGCNANEIIAVLAHELGHWKLNHVLKNLIIGQVQIFLMFAFFAYLSKSKPLYVAFGFHTETPVLMGMMIVLNFILAPYSAVINFAMTVLSRRYEFQADAFAASLGKSDGLRTALIKLNNDNLSFPIYDSLYSAWNHSHPPILERLDALKRKED